MSEIIILVDELPKGCDKCAYLISKGYKAGYPECKFTGYVSERDSVPNFRSESCPLRLRSRYVELPEGYEVSEKSYMATGIMEIPIKRVEVEG